MAASLGIIVCGGTLDKHYDPLQGELGFTQTHLPEMLSRARITIPVRVEALPLLDSLDMLDADRERVLSACQAAPESALVVTHGTDTMPETARVLGSLFSKGLQKTIVLTGAMIPYAIDNSDALFNLGFACACAQTLPHGVYIAMNGRVFAWDRVTKNRAQGVFENI